MCKNTINLCSKQVVLENVLCKPAWSIKMSNRFLRTPLMPQTHRTTVPYDFSTRTFFLRTRGHFTPVLFSWSYQATGSARLENNRQYSIYINYALVFVFNYILHISRITYITRHNATLWLIVDWTPPKNGAWLLQCPRGSNNNVK